MQKFPHALPVVALRHCPFCGAKEANLVGQIAGRGMIDLHVECGHCLARGTTLRLEPEELSEGAQSVARYWNEATPTILEHITRRARYALSSIIPH